MANNQMSQRHTREPTESEDPVFTSSQGSPTFIRRDLRTTTNTRVNEAPSIKPQNNYSQTTDLPDLLNKVELGMKNEFPSRDFVGQQEGTSVDHTTNISQTQRKSIPTEHTDSTSVENEHKNATNSLNSVPDSHSHVENATTPQPKLRRKSSSLEVKTLTLPKVNCPEKIFLCVDHSEEMFRNKFQTQSANQTSVFKTLTNALKQFVCTKSYLNKKHQFSLVMLNDDAQLITDFSPNYEELLFMLNDIAASPMHDKTASQQNNETQFDLTNMFNVIKQHAGLPRLNKKQASKIPPPYIVRVVFIYGRSNTRPKFLSGSKNFALLNNSPFFFIDCVYIHEESSENNNVESIFSEICSLDVRGTSHIYEVGTDSNMACLYNVLAKFLAHPLQRPKQAEDSINYNLEAE